MKRVNGFLTLLRWVGRALALALLVILGLALLGNTVQVPWSSRYSSSLDGRTPVTFAAGCNDLGATLTEVDRGDERHSACTAATSDTISCDWMGQRCVVECAGTKTVVDAVRMLSDRGSTQECDALRYLAYIPPWLGEATPAAPAAADEAVNTGG